MKTPATPTAQADVVVVGSYVQDLAWRCATFPTPGQTTLGTFTSGPGGKGSNQAVAAGRAGASTLFVGAVGEDAFAREAADFYTQNRIGARFIAKRGHPTGTASILVDANGQNQIVVALGANARLMPRDLPASLFHGARVVVTQLEASLSSAAHALRAGRRAGAITVLNPAPMRVDFDPMLLRYTDVLVPNETELLALVNLLGLTSSQNGYTQADLEAAPAQTLHALCRQLGPADVIITLGRRGCFVSRPDGHLTLPAHKVKAVDTTGAGDAFIGGLSAGLARHAGDLRAAVRLGQATAALSVTKPGTAPSMPSAREISAFLRQRRG